MGLTSNAMTAAQNPQVANGTGGTPITTDWIQKNLYQGTLGRDADQEELNYWQNAVNTGSLSESQLRSNFSEAARKHLAAVPYDEKQRLAPKLYSTNLSQTQQPVPAQTQQKTPPAQTAETPLGFGVKKENWSGLIGKVQQPEAVMRPITENETVAGQMDKLLADNSKYLQSARASGMALANNRGLVNSSLAAGAAEKAAIDAAAPIAAQDASTYAASGLSAQNANQETKQLGYKGQIDSVVKMQELYNAAVLQQQQGGITQENTAQKYALETQLQTTLKQMDINIDMEKIASNDRQSYVNAIGPIMQQYQNSYITIQQQPDNVMDASAKAAALSDLHAMYKPQLESISNLYGYTVDWGVESAAVAGWREGQSKDEQSNDKPSISNIDALLP